MLDKTPKICFKQLILKCFFFIQLPSSFVFLSVGPLTISNVSFSSLWTWRINRKNCKPFMKHFMLCQVIRLLCNCTNNWSFYFIFFQFIFYWLKIMIVFRMLLLHELSGQSIPLQFALQTFSSGLSWSDEENQNTDTKSSIPSAFSKTAIPKFD